MDNDFTPSFQVIRSIFSPRGLLWLGHRIQIYYEVRIWSKFPANRELSHQQAVKLSPWCVRCTFLTTTRAAEVHGSWWSPVASDQTPSLQLLPSVDTIVLGRDAPPDDKWSEYNPSLMLLWSIRANINLDNWNTFCNVTDLEPQYVSRWLPILYKFWTWKLLCFLFQQIIYHPQNFDWRKICFDWGKMILLLQIFFDVLIFSGAHNGYHGNISLVLNSDIFRSL